MHEDLILSNRMNFCYHFRLEPTPKTYGITSPISLQGPKPEDLVHTEKLIEALKPHGVFENEDELNHR